MHHNINATHKNSTFETKQEGDLARIDSDEEINEEIEAPSTKPKEEAMPKIPLAPITRIVQPQMLKLRGYIKKRKCHCVSTHKKHS